MWMFCVLGFHVQFDRDLKMYRQYMKGLWSNQECQKRPFENMCIVSAWFPMSSSLTLYWDLIYHPTAMAGGI